MHHNNLSDKEKEKEVKYALHKTRYLEVMSMKPSQPLCPKLQKKKTNLANCQLKYKTLQTEMTLEQR